MSRTYDIPIIARGRLIPPGDDAVEYGGRAGARFRTPDPHKHVDDLVLGDPTRLRDLQETPTRDIIAFLAELGARLSLKNPLMQEAFELSLEAGGITEPILRGIYADIPALFDAKFLTEMVDATIGIRHLDGWTPQGEGDLARVRVRAVGTRQLHITAGNVPVVGALTLIRAALTKSDCLIKLPSNDPLSANAIARAMIELDADHPVTRHVAVAYWKGGDEFMDSQICRTSRIDKITAWGGMSSVRHIQKYLSPGIDLIALNPKLSISIVGREALESEAAMKEAAAGVAFAAGKMNQTACVNTRVVYVESQTDDASLERVIELGREIYRAFQELPPIVSTPAPKANLDLEAELQAVELEEESYWMTGDTVLGGVVVSKFSDRVDFHGQLNNRIVNLVPLPDLQAVARWCDDTTQAVGIYPERLRPELRDVLALAGVQRMYPLEKAGERAVDQASAPGLPHDGIEPMRRSVRWVVEELREPERDAFRAAAE